MFLKKLIVPILCTITLSVQSQEVKFGRISKTELSEKFNEKDSSAVATYLYKSQKSYFEYEQSLGFKLITDVHERIKIYAKDGFKYATKKVNLYKNRTDIEKISSLKAITFNLAGNSIEETKLKKDGEFDTELSEFYDQKSFTMPKVREGSVIEYKYRITSPFLSNVDEFVLQHDIPIKHLVASMETPEYLNYRINIKGFLPVRPKKESKPGAIRLKSKSRSNVTTAARTNFSSETINYKKYVDFYELLDVPALADEPFVNNMDNYRSAVKYELSSTQFPNSIMKNYSNTWKGVVKTIYQNTNFGIELNKEGYYEKDLEGSISGVDDAMKKVSLIYDFVRSRVKWNGHYGKYTNDGVRKAYNEKVGNVAEINLMLTSMLRYAGLKANPVLISTRDNGIPLFPTREGYNYVIAGIEYDGDIILLDATSRYSSINVLPIRTLNWEGRLIMENGDSKTISMTPKVKSQDMVMMEVKLNDDGSIKGKMRQQYKSHNAFLFRTKYNKGTEEAFLEQEEKDNFDVEISNYELKNINDLNKPIVQSYDFAKEDVLEVISSKIYFPPLFHLAENENPFKLENREYPVDFGFPWKDKYIVNTIIPEGYHVVSLPESKIISLPDNLGIFKYTIKSNETTINLKAELVFNVATIPAQYYQTLKEFYRQLVEKETEKVVLSKTFGDEHNESATGSR